MLLGFVPASKKSLAENDICCCLSFVRTGVRGATCFDCASLTFLSLLASTVPHSSTTAAAASSLPPLLPGLAGLQCLFQSFRWGQIRHIRYLVQFIVIQSCCAPAGHQEEGPRVLVPDRPHTRTAQLLNKSDVDLLNVLPYCSLTDLPLNSCVTPFMALDIISNLVS